MYRYTAAWLLLVVVAIINGTLREFTYGNLMSELAAHQLSTIILALFSGVFVWKITRVWPIDTPSKAWLIGVVWLGLTVSFEFGFGHFVAGHSWSRLLADYNLLAGRIWALFVIWILVLPYLACRMAKR